MEEHYPVEEFQAILGKGVKGKVQGLKVEVVSPGYLAEMGFSATNEKVEKLSLQGKTIVFVVVEGVLSIAVALADILRPESKETVSKLK